MKKCLFLLSFFVLICEPSVCLQKEDFYFGLDGQTRSMGYKKGFGDLIAKKHHPQANIYLGYKINENIAIELGREETASKIRYATLREGQSINGVPLPACLEPAFFKTKVKVRGPHIDFVLSKIISDTIPLRILGSIGVSSLTIICDREAVSVGHPSIPGPNRHMKKHSAALRVMGGLQYAFENGIGIRASLSFVNTGGMVVKVKDSSAKFQVVPKVLPKDTLLLGLGVVVPF